MAVLPELQLIFISFSTFYASALIRIAVQMLSFPVPHNFFVALLGMTFGYLSSFYPMMDLMKIAESAPQIVMSIIIPVIMFEASFFTNLESFAIAGVHVALLVLFTFSLSVGIIGFIVVAVFDYGWDWNHAVILTSVIVAPGPVVTMAFLKRLIAPLKLQYFLESEAITGNCLALIIFKFCILWSLSNNLYLKDYTIGLCVSPLFGFVVAKTIAYWMSKIMNDSLNQICIVIASVYSCYCLAEISRMDGLIAVVFMGMFLTGKRSNMTDNTEKLLLKSLHVLSSYFNCNLTMLCGMKLSTVLPTLTWEDCGNIIKIFTLVNIIRVLVVALLYPLLRKHGYCLSLSNLLVVAVCNIRGVITVLLAFCILNDNFKIHNEVKMFTLAVSQVVLSLLVNTTIANLVIRNGVFHESKARTIANTHAMLRDIQQDSIFVFKHTNKYLADADWSIVEKFTQLQHPLLKTTFRSDEMRQSDTQKTKTLEHQAVYRILMMMKCSYWKQYGEGLLSHNAVKLLLHWSSRALAKGNNLIFPSKIQSVLKVPKYYEQLKYGILERLQDWILFGTYSKLLQTTIGSVVICIYFVDLNMTLFQLNNEIFILDPKREFILFWYNLIFITCHGVLFVCRVLFQKKVTVWEILIALLVLLGIIDLVVIKVFSSSTSWSRLLRLLLISTRIVRVLRVAEVLPFILRIALEICNLNISMLLADGFDIACGYIRGRLEVMRLLNHVECDIPRNILKKYKSVCSDHKLETVRMLEYLQMKHPVISASAKTRQAIRIVMTKQLTVLMNLEKLRVMRHKDGTHVKKMIMTRMTTYLDKWITAKPPSYESIIARVPWIQAEAAIFKLIMQKGEIIKYKRSEYLVTQSSHPGGLFIILHGIAVPHSDAYYEFPACADFLLMFVLRRKVWKNVELFTEQVVDYLTAGSVIGEFTFLTGKARHKAVVCETNLKVMYIRYQYLWQYIGGTPSVRRFKLSTLEEKMWKTMAIKLAYRLLIAEPDWQTLSRSEILNKLVNGIIVDGHAEPQSFAHHIQTADVILIYGKLVDLASNDVVGGPVFIPKGHGHFSLLNDGKLRPILYILPEGDDDDDHVRLPCRFKTRWDLCTVTEARSDVTLSSGGSSSRPSFVPRSVYLGSSAVSATSKSSDFGTIESFGYETEL